MMVGQMVGPTVARWAGWLAVRMVAPMAVTTAGHLVARRVAMMVDALAVATVEPRAVQ